MKLFVLHSDIYAPLQAVSRSIAVKPQLPVLSNVLLQTEKDYLKVSATNLEIGVIKKIPAEILEEGEITIPAKVFAEIINSLAGEKICLESSADQLKISTENFSGVLNGISATEFPTIPLSSEKSISINGELLHTALPEISFAAAIDEARPILTGILTQIKDHTLELVATDGFRLAHKKVPLPNANSLNFKALIPRRTFEEVARLINEDLKGEDNTAEISIATSENQNQMIFTINATQLSSRLIEGNYPVWEKIVPQSFITTIVLNRLDLIKAIKLAAVFARDAANVVKLTIDQNKVKVISEARELGQQETAIDASVEGESLQISFNNKYLLDALSNCNSKEITIKFSGNLSPALIVPSDEDGLEYVVMPIRTS